MDFTKRIYPPQPHFDMYLRQRNIIPEHFYQQRGNPLILNMQMPNPSGKVDIMRLSYNVMRNLKKEEEEGSN